MIEATDEMHGVFEYASDIPAGVAAVLAIVERDYVVKPRSIRLTPSQVELLTDIAAKPAMYITKFSQWSRTAQALVARGLAHAPTGYAGAQQYELRITEAGRAEASRRGLVNTAPYAPEADRG
jgi:malonyl CoA-acyl carrier protein transacylase